MDNNSKDDDNFHNASQNKNGQKGKGSEMTIQTRHNHNHNNRRTSSMVKFSIKRITSLSANTKSTQTDWKTRNTNGQKSNDIITTVLIFDQTVEFVAVVASSGPSVSMASRQSTHDTTIYNNSNSNNSICSKQTNRFDV